MSSSFDPLAVNLQRLFSWHGLSNVKVAEVIGSTPNTVGSWLGGGREPSASYILLIGRLFGVDPRDLYDAPPRFGQRIAEPSRLDEMDKLEWKRRGWLVDSDGVAFGGAPTKEEKST